MYETFFYIWKIGELLGELWVFVILSGTVLSFITDLAFSGQLYSMVMEDLSEKGS